MNFQPEKMEPSFDRGVTLDFDMNEKSNDMTNLFSVLHEVPPDWLAQEEPVESTN